MKKTANLQDIFLTKARKQGVPLTVFLVNGFQMRGSVTGFDSFTVVGLSEGWLLYTNPSPPDSNK